MVFLRIKVAEKWQFCNVVEDVAAKGKVFGTWYLKRFDRFMEIQDCHSQGGIRSLAQEQACCGFGVDHYHPWNALSTKPQVYNFSSNFLTKC